MILKNNEEIVKLFLSEEGKAKATTQDQKLFISKGILFSHGEHYPLAKFIDGNLLVSDSPCSLTTKSQKDLLLEHHEGEVIYAYNCSLKKIDVNKYMGKMFKNTYNDKINAYQHINSNIKKALDKELLTLPKTMIDIINEKDIDVARKKYYNRLNYVYASESIKHLHLLNDRLSKLDNSAKLNKTNLITEDKHGRLYSSKEGLLEGNVADKFEEIFLLIIKEGGVLTYNSDNPNDCIILKSLKK
jgi:hypothetical protein